jgi:3-hydroxyacyl-[acyl-carrier-protein] dehydratase
VTVLNWRSTMVKLSGVITVDGKVASQAKITCAVMPRTKA